MVWGLITTMLLLVVLPVSEVFASTIGYFAPSSASGTGWTNSANILTSNNLYTTATRSSKKLTASGFNISSIPGNATIDGIEVTVEGYHSAGSARNVMVALWNATSGAWSSSKTTSLTTTDTTFTFGNTTDLWGKAWSANDFANANFKIQLTSTGFGGTIYIDQVQVKVHFTPGNTTLALSPVSGNYDGISSMTATLTQSGTGTPISGKAINFTLNGSSVGNATTNASGVATLSSVSLSGIDAGYHPNGAGASFGGDASYQVTSITAALNVNGSATTLTVDSASGTYVGSGSGTISLSATLIETISGSPISGKTVSFSTGDISIGSGTTDASGYVSISGASLTGYDEGSYPGEIVASFSNNGIYEGSTGSGTLTVNPKVLTIISVTANNRIYDTTTTAALNTGSAALSGVVSGDSVTLDVSGAMGSFSNANIGTGKTVITAGFTISGVDAGNYSLTQPTAVANITAYPITVTANAMNKTYGDVDPAFTYTNTPLLGSDVFSGSLSRAAGEDVGTYAINQGTLSAGGNYSIAFVGANLTINVKAITVTADEMDKSYGDADQAFTYTNTPLVGSDAFSGSLSRDAGEDVGTYAINQGTLSAGGNYSIAFVGANLTINVKAITVTADEMDKSYGDADPAFTYTNTPLVGSDAFNGSLSRDAGEDVGTYAINQGTLSAGGNYSIAFVGASLTINTRDIIVTADVQSKATGDSDPIFTFGVVGFVNTDSFIVEPTCDVPGSHDTAGEYDIVCSSGGAGANYNIVYVNGVLTVTNAIAERLGNGGFNIYDGASKIPMLWKATNFSATDGKDTKSKLEGTASIKIAGTLGKTKSLKQTIFLDGVSGDQLTFSFWAKGKSIPTVGKCLAIVKLYNGSTVVDVKKIPCDTGNYSVFQQKSVSFIASSNFTKIAIKLTYAKATGTVWFDGVSLLK